MVAKGTFGEPHGMASEEGLEEYRQEYGRYRQNPLNYTLGGTLAAHGWTGLTALCYLLFSLCHFPCATTLWTMAKEAGGLKWALLAAALPTAVGVGLCGVVAAVGRTCG